MRSLKLLFVVSASLAFAGCSLTTDLDGLAGTPPLEAGTSADVSLEASADTAADSSPDAAADDVFEATTSPDVVSDASTGDVVDEPCGQTVCGDECVDILSAQKHCGRCDHDCLGGACELGQCKPLLVTQDAAGALTLIREGSHIFWTNRNSGAVWRANLDPPFEPVQIVTGPPGPEDLASDGVRVFWTNTAQGTVGRVGIDGASPITLAQIPMAGGIGVGPSYVFVASSDGSVWRIPKDPANDGAQELIASGSFVPKRIALRGEQLFFTDTAADPPGISGGIWVTPALPGSQPNRLLVGSTHHLVVSDTAIYFSAWTEGYIRRSGLDGSNPTYLAQGQYPAACVAIDGTHVYWTAHGDGDAVGAIRRAPLDGGGIETLADHRRQPFGIALTDKAVYWADMGDGSILRIAK